YVRGSRFTGRWRGRTSEGCLVPLDPSGHCCQEPSRCCVQPVGGSEEVDQKATAHPVSRGRPRIRYFCSSGRGQKAVRRGVARGLGPPPQPLAHFRWFTIRAAGKSIVPRQTCPSPGGLRSAAGSTVNVPDREYSLASSSPITHRVFASGARAIALGRWMPNGLARSRIVAALGSATHSDCGTPPLNADGAGFTGRLSLSRSSHRSPPLYSGRKSVRPKSQKSCTVPPTESLASCSSTYTATSRRSSPTTF